MRQKWEHWEAREIARHGPFPEAPEVCPKCKADLESHSGMVGEEVLVCPKHGIVWEDCEDALWRVI